LSLENYTTGSGERNVESRYEVEKEKDGDRRTII